MHHSLLIERKRQDQYVTEHRDRRGDVQTDPQRQAQRPSLTPHRPNGVAQGVAQDPLLLVVQDKHAVHGELLGAGRGQPGAVMHALLEGDGLAPLVGVDAGRGGPVPRGLRHGVLAGGGGCDHWGQEGHGQGHRGESVRRREALSRASRPPAASPAAKLQEERAGGAGKYDHLFLHGDSLGDLGFPCGYWSICICDVCCFFPLSASVQVPKLPRTDLKIQGYWKEVDLRSHLAPSLTTCVITGPSLTSLASVSSAAQAGVRIR